MVKVASFLLTAALTAQQPLLFSVEPWKPQTVCAHRGALSKTDLENSVTVIAKTFKAGVPMVEIDLRESKDKTMYLLHDQTLDRTTNSSGHIHDFTDKQLAQIYLVDPSTRKPVEPIPTFEELLRWEAQSRAKIMVDIKDTPPADAVNLIRKYGVLQNVILLTFDRPTAELAYASDADVLVSVLVKSDAEIDRAIQDAMGHPTALYVPQNSLPEVFAHAKATGKQVISDALGSLDDEAAAEQMSVAVYERYLRTHPVNVFVTNHALLLAGGTSGSM